MIFIVIQDVGSDQFLSILLPHSMVQEVSLLLVKPIIGSDSNKSIIGPAKFGNLKFPTLFILVIGNMAEWQNLITVRRNVTADYENQNLGP